MGKTCVYNIIIIILNVTWTQYMYMGLDTLTHGAKLFI